MHGGESSVVLGTRDASVRKAHLWLSTVSAAFPPSMHVLAVPSPAEKALRALAVVLNPYRKVKHRSSRSRHILAESQLCISAAAFGPIFLPLRVSIGYGQSMNNR